MAVQGVLEEHSLSLLYRDRPFSQGQGPACRGRVLVFAGAAEGARAQKTKQFYLPALKNAGGAGDISAAAMMASSADV